jgi:hypothetical protein
MFVILDLLLLIDWHTSRKDRICNPSEKSFAERKSKLFKTVLIIEALAFAFLIESSSARIVLLPNSVLRSMNITHNRFLDEIIAYDMSIPNNRLLLYAFFSGLVCYFVSLFGFFAKMTRHRFFILSGLCFFFMALEAIFLWEHTRGHMRLSMLLLALLTLAPFLFLHGCLLKGTKGEVAG